MPDLETSVQVSKGEKSSRLVMVDFLGAGVNPTDPLIMSSKTSTANFFERLKHNASVWEPDIAGKATMMQVNQILMNEICGYILVMGSSEHDLTEDNCARIDAARNIGSSIFIFFEPMSVFPYPTLKAKQCIDLSNWNGLEKATEFQRLMQWISALKERADVIKTDDEDDVAELPSKPEVDAITGTDVGPPGGETDIDEDQTEEVEETGHDLVSTRLSKAVLDEIEGRIAAPDWSLAQSRTLLERAAPDKDIETIRQAAAQDHLPSVTLLGLARLLGYGVKRDRPAALKHFERAAKIGGFPRAMREYGCLLDIAPRGITRDVDEARHWLTEAAGAGIVKAKTDLARHLFGSKVGKVPGSDDTEDRDAREAKAVALLREAQTDDVQAKGLLGWAVFNGRGTRQSVDQGQTLLRRAADAGDAVAAFVIADAYLRGQNANKDPQVAYRWFKKSAQRGHPHAPFYMGWMHWYGVGTDRSYRDATQWMEKAAEYGDQDAPLYIADAKRKGLDGPVDMQGAVAVLEAAAETNPKAAAQLGDAYLFGKGVPENEQKALELYQGVALQPETDVYSFRTDEDIKPDAPARALVGLGRILEAGRLEKRNRAGAVALFKTATTRTKEYPLLQEAYTQLYALGERPQPN
ncbi:MAG: tetratricopeptide repeat protein [Pseudomonadota bacterium]